MNVSTFWFCIAGLAVGVPAYGQHAAGVNDMTAVQGVAGIDRVARIRELKIEGCHIVSVAREDAPTVTNAEGKVFNNVPPRTVVKLVLNPAQRSNINVEIWLPDAETWNGRFLGLGNGGSAGRIQSTSLIWPVNGGYAVATTDMGTAPNADSGIGNPEVWKDFGFRATHLMTVAAKQVVTAFYGKGPEYSYFNGGSTGGQQGLQTAQRYPEDYDGIVAAVPAHCRTSLHAYFLWNHQILNKCPFSEAQEASVIAAGNEYMAAREVPAVAGKFVSDPRSDSKDIEAVIALVLRKDATLTPAHVEAMRKLFDGPRHEVTGERIFNGIPIGSDFDGARGNLYLFKWVFGADKNLDEINFGADIDTYTATLGPYLSAENPDLSRFQQRGGKLIVTSGAADEVVPYHATLDYYERVVEYFGALKKVQSFFKYFVIPGMSHSGGPGVMPHGSLLDAVRNWREKGVGPNQITGRRVVDGKTEIEMPLYPYPLKTGWDAATGSYKPVQGPRGGVERVAERFRPGAKE